MIIKMELVSDTIFGNGRSIPGEEDISVLTDEYGFPYFKGGTFKGIFREELTRYLALQTGDESRLKQFLGYAGDDGTDESAKLFFSDFKLSDAVKNAVLSEIGHNDSKAVLDTFTSLRIFTKIGSDGTAADGSLRVARCVNKGIVFYSEIRCSEDEGPEVEKVLGLIKWVGSMRNRGFGRVKVSAMKGGK